MRSPTLLFLFLFALLALAPAHAPALTGGPDTYGYTFTDSTETGGPAFQWIDITTTGTAVITGGDDVSSNDAVNGIGAPVDLGFPLTLYGNTVSQLVPTSNGYLSTDPAETGADATNDCPIPQIPSHGAGDRFLVLHDDLTLASGGVFYQYFPDSPHPHNDCGVSIFTWDLITEKNSGEKISFQALLFDNGDIIYQYDAGNTDGSSSGLTIGITDDVKVHGLAYDCDDGTNGLAFPAGLAVLFRPPLIIVTTEADEFDAPGAGGSVSLREAIRDIAAGGRVEFDPAVEFIDLSTGVIPDTLSIGSKPLAIDGGDQRVCISGGKADRIVVDDDVLFLENLCFVDGKDVQGGAIYSLGFLGICDVEFVGNESTSSGGAIWSNGEVRLNRCRFHQNIAPTGSAIFGSGPGSIMELRASEFSCNRGASALQGASGTRLLVDRCSFFDNYRESGTTDTGALVVSAIPDVDIIRSTFSHNRNRAMRLSAISGESVLVAHCTITGNVANTVPAIEAAVTTGTVEITHTILAGNHSRSPGSGTVSPSITSTGYNLADDAPSALSQPTDTINTDPELGPLGPYGGPTFSRLPLFGSPAIDAGNPVPPATAGSIDQRGLPRVADGDGGIATIDIGAVESGIFRTVTTAVDENNTPGTGAGASLRELLAIAQPGDRIVFANPGLSGATITLDSGLGTIGFADPELIVHIDASPLALPVTIEPDGSFRSFSLTLGAHASFHRVRLIEGLSIGSLSIESGSGATLDRCLVSNPNGRGMSIIDSRLTMNGCEVRECASSFSGAGLFFNDSRARISGSLIADNHSTAIGGGIDCVNSQLTLLDSSIVGNTGLNGAGLYFGVTTFGVDPAILKVSGCTFSGNDASGKGGGLGITGDITAEITHSTIYKNSSTSGAAGIELSTSTVVEDALGLGHNIIAANALKGSGRITNATNNAVYTYSLGYNLSDTSSAVLGAGTGDMDNTVPQLGPLTFHHDSMVPAHYPLVGCPSIDSGDAALSSYRFFDQLNGARRADGDANGSDIIDIGAVEAAEPIVVTTVLDEFDTPSTTGSGDISLREAVRDAPDGGRVTFLDPLPGSGLIALGSGAVFQNTEIDIDQSLVIDATNQPAGIVVSGPAAQRVLDLPTPGKRVSLHGISVTGGQSPDFGGGLNVTGGHVTMSHGAIYNNFADSFGGGAILNGATALFESVTISGNEAGSQGGAIFAFSGSEFTMRHCTIYDNECTGNGAGFVLANADLELFSSIIAENRRQNGTLSNSFISSGGTVTSLGFNLTDGTFISDPTDLVAAFPIGLEPLAFAGGLAPTHPPNATSSAINTGPVDFFAGRPCTDARGFPRVACGRMDIGAYELGANLPGAPGLDLDGDGMDDSWELIYGLNVGINDSALDLDADGASNLDEFLAQTKPNDAGSVLCITNITIVSDSPWIEWNAVRGLRYSVYASEDLGQADPWGPLVLSTTGAFSTPSGTINFAFPSIDIDTIPIFFFQVRIAD